MNPEMNPEVNSPEALPILNIAFYRFAELSDPREVQGIFRELCGRFPSFKGTILVSSEGINGMLGGLIAEVRQFQEKLEQEPLWKGMSFKESYSAFVPFTRFLVKVKKEIIPLGNPEIKPLQRTAQRLSPAELKKWFDENKDFDLVDTRNSYEIEHGTFEKAVTFKLRHFRKFPEKFKEWTENQKSEHSVSKPLVMFCTGGIRCEKASVVALDSGYQDVYQLDGGILNYFAECAGAHYKGSCFVFDQREALDPYLKPLVQSPVEST